MNIFDESELDKKIAEAEATFGEEKKEAEKPPEKEELPEEVEEKVEVVEDTKEAEIEEAAEEEEDERPTDAEGWKRLRKKKQAAKAEAEEQKKIAEKALLESQELKERLARLEGREEARAKPEVKEAESDPEPDKDLDPDLHIAWKIRKLEERTTAAEKRAAAAEEVGKIEGTRRGLQMVEKDYIKANKLDDYDAAIEHIRTVNRNLIKLKHPTATIPEIDAHLEAERIREGAESYAKGVNPAEYFYKMAQTYGYQKAKPAKQNDKPNIDALNRNMGKNANLLGHSNTDNTGALPTEKVVQMSIDQLLKAEGTAALEAAIKREEAKMTGL